MKTRILTIAIALVVISTGTFTSCTKNSRKKIRIKGSTTVLPLTQKSAEAYSKISTISISIDGSGSGNGIKALIDGSCDIANASRAMKSKEIKKAQAKGIAAKEITVAFDMIVPIVHSSNNVKNLTMDQLKAIYEGQIINWQEVGGKDLTIVVISRDTSSGTYEVWHKNVMKKKDVRKDALLQASNGAIVTSVAENRKAIGYIGFGYINSSIKPVNVNGVIPTLENGKSGKFAISRKLFMYINETTISKEAMDFVNYLTGPEGQKIVKKAGFIPL